MKFIADDGKIFDTMEECEEHEKISNSKYIAMMWYMSITMYDVDGKVVRSIFKWDKDTKDYLDNTNDICCNEARFIKIDCSADGWEKIINYFADEYDTYLPDYEKDIFRYTIDDEWVSSREEYAALQKRWEVVGVRF